MPSLTSQLEGARVIQQRLGNRLDEAQAQVQLAITAAGIGPYEMAQRAGETCIGVFRELGVSFTVANCLAVLAEVCSVHGEHELALTYARKAYELLRHDDRTWGAVASRLMLGGRHV